MTDRIKALEDALRTKAAMIELGDKIAWGSDVALMREAADTLAASRAASDCHQPDLVTADASPSAQPVAVKDAARVPEIAALIEAATAAKQHIRGALGFTLNAALRAIAEGRA